MRISDWSSDVCSSDLRAIAFVPDFCRTGIFGGRNLNVLGNVHDNRTRTTRSGDMKRLVADMAEFRRVLHQIIMLGAMAGEADRVRFLKGVRDRKSNRLNSSHQLANPMTAYALTQNKRQNY